jgi:hypothetical protein
MFAQLTSEKLYNWLNIPWNLLYVSSNIQWRIYFADYWWHFSSFPYINKWEGRMRGGRWRSSNLTRLRCRRVWARRGVESPAGPRETNVFGPLPTCRLSFVYAEYDSLGPESFRALKTCKFGPQNKRISFDYPVFLLSLWFPGPLFRSGPRETVTPFTPSLWPCGLESRPRPSESMKLFSTCKLILSTQNSTNVDSLELHL